MKRFTLLLLCLPILLLTACDEGCFGPRVRGVGPTETETRTLNSFSRIDLKIDAEVILTQGPQQEVRIEAQRNILDIIETEQRGEKLEIEFKGYNVKSHTPIRIYLTMPTVSELEVSGSGKISSATSINTTSLELDISGSGKMNLDCQADVLRSHISGSGHLDLRGTAPSHTLSISGSGQVNSYDLTTQDTYVSISGSGRSYLTASRTLEADISGSGSIHYRGQPQVSVHTSGSGKVINAN